jgi:hypothetical protein
MPTFLLRDGREQSVRQAPEGLDCFTYRDLNGRTIHALLDSASERRLLEHGRRLLPLRRRSPLQNRRAA